MVIQHNIAALNSHRNLGINNANTSKNLEKLSSGYRINRAGDDAAGLAISEKMRGQIRGLAMAEQNTSNGISLIQTAEGGLNETHAILQRMRELAVQSSNGTFQNEDREQIALEVTALKSEIDRIASSTHYNQINLLDGSLGGLKASDSDNIDKVFGTTAGTVTIAGVTNAAKDLLKDQTVTVTVRSSGTVANNVYSVQVGDKTYITKDNSSTAESVKLYDEEGNHAVTIGGVITTGGTKSGVITNILMDNAGTALSTTDGLKNAKVAGLGQELTFQIGANGGADQKVGLHVDNMSTGNLGLAVGESTANNKSGTIAGIDVSTQEKANEAIKVIDAATNQVSAQRAQLGALQNRLEHTMNNLGVTKENLTAAESTIRDVDMAKEMMEFTKNNILVQASQAMLAQANSLPQGVLSLLR